MVTTEYKRACSVTESLSFYTFFSPGRQNENQEISPKRIRRNSDSSLHVTSNERLIVLKLREEEIKLYQEKIKKLKEEIEKLRTQVEQLSGGGKESASSELKTGSE